MKAKRLTSAVCALALALTLTAAQETAQAWAAPCFAGEADYTYADDTRSIAIQRIVWDESTGYVADVQLRDGAGFHAALARNGFEALSAMARREGAVLALNADDYGTHKYGVIIRDGQTLRIHDTTRHTLAVFPDGSVQTVSDPASINPSDWARALTDAGVMHTFAFGPVLVENGEITAFPRSFDVISTRPSRREPRTALGVIAPLHYVVVVLDGRQPGYSSGVSLQSLQQLGVQTAINLDGDGSTELWFQGEILNQPAGGHERKLSDCIWF